MKGQKLVVTLVQWPGGLAHHDRAWVMTYSKHSNSTSFTGTQLTHIYLQKHPECWPQKERQSDAAGYGPTACIYLQLTTDIR